MNGQILLSQALSFLWPTFSNTNSSDLVCIEKIRRAAAIFRKDPASELAAVTSRLRGQVVPADRNGPQGIMIESFALAVEAVRRVLGIELYDVQLLGGIAMARGSIAEMQTGEGKTYTAILPAVYFGLVSRGVHLMTVNPYLARRDFEQLAPIYRLLGLSVGLVLSQSSPDEKRAAYSCDITYGPGYEFGFDYLRDQIAAISHKKPRLGEAFRSRQRSRPLDAPKALQRELAAAIVDEADSVMLDEANTPLVLAVGGKQPALQTEAYSQAAKIASEFAGGRHFKIEKAASTLALTEVGLQLLRAKAIAIPRGELERPWAVYIEQALRAQWLFQRDVDYVINDGAIQLVDRQTGRILPDRSWRDGLEQAIQNKEGVAVTTEATSIARISRQCCFRSYKNLCGMTGTIQGSERELHDVYRLPVAVIPPHKPCSRQTLPTRFFLSLDQKEQTIVAEVTRLHRAGRPVLVGTATIESSIQLAQRLTVSGVPHQLLNGKQDAQEASIVALAGQAQSITIATNMAGRGTDIKLGKGVAELGGLHVIASEPQDSARAHRQLVGRAARQGDPGSSQLFVSADDVVVEKYSPALADRIRALADQRGEAQFASELDAAINELQCRAQRDRSKQRQQMFDHDDWLEKVMRELS